MEWDTVRFETAEHDERVGFLVLDRPAVLNAVNDQLIADFKQACDALRHAPSLRVVVLKAEGRGFCSGMDLMAAAHRPHDKETLEAVWAPWGQALDTLEQLDQLTMAAIHGPCLGAGLELVLACDFRIATTSAFFALPQILYGTPPDVGQNYRLPQLIGLAKAKEIMLLGQRFSAAEAERWGLVTRLVEPGDLAAETDALVERCLQLGGKAAAGAKHLLHRTWELDNQALAAAIHQARATALEDGAFAASLEAYRDRRKPQV